MDHDVTLTEAERQIVVQGLAWIAAARPGWLPGAILPIVEKLNAKVMLESFIRLRQEQAKGRGEEPR